VGVGVWVLHRTSILCVCVCVCVRVLVGVSTSHASYLVCVCVCACVCGCGYFTGLVSSERNSEVENVRTDKIPGFCHGEPIRHLVIKFVIYYRH